MISPSKVKEIVGNDLFKQIQITWLIEVVEKIISLLNPPLSSWNGKNKIITLYLDVKC